MRPAARAGRGDLVRAGVGDHGQQVEIEGPPDDGGRRRHLARPRGQVLRTAQHGVTQRVRHRGCLHRRPGLRRQGMIIDGCEQFLDVQRDAVAALVDRRHHLGRSWRRAPRWPRSRSGPAPAAAAGSPRRAAGPAGGHAGRAWAARGRAHRSGTCQRPVSASSRTGRPDGRAHQGSARRPSADPRDQQQRDAGIRGHEQVGQVLHQQAAPVVCITSAGGDRAHPRRQVPPEGAQGRLGRGHQAAGQIQQQSRGRLRIAGERRGAGPAKPLA